MAPAVTLQDTFDFDAVPIAHAPTLTKAAEHRTLLLAPPSLAAHPEALDRVYEIHDRKHADLQMLDRLALGLVSLPPATYDVVMVLTDADGTRTESWKLLDRSIMNKIVEALKAGGKLKGQDGTLGSTDGPVKTEAILAGLTVDGDSLTKPESTGGGVVQLNFTRRKKETNGINGFDTNNTVPLNGKRKEPEPVQPAGVGFVDFGDDLDIPIITGEDDELIDEDDLLTEEDKMRPIVIPPECRPKTGKRRRACKDCTCGLKEKLEAEDTAKRSEADKALNTMKLKADELAEVDFTVQGKVGSCGNCALGDAFRCDGCPYIGLPAFKPGEEVRLLNDDIQL